MSNAMNEKELKEFEELGRRLLEVENSNDVNCGWFKVSRVTKEQVWIHKFGATIYLSDAKDAKLNNTYAAEAWTAYRYLQQRLVLDRIARET